VRGGARCHCTVTSRPLYMAARGRSPST
jgi:hypothetical protein